MRPSNEERPAHGLAQRWDAGRLPGVVFLIALLVRIVPLLRDGTLFSGLIGYDAGVHFLSTERLLAGQTEMGGILLAGELQW